MHVRFTRDFDWTPPEDSMVTIARLTGFEGAVKRDFGEAAVAAGAATEIATPTNRADASA